MKEQYIYSPITLNHPIASSTVNTLAAPVLLLLSRFWFSSSFHRHVQRQKCMYFFFLLFFCVFVCENVYISVTRGNWRKERAHVLFDALYLVENWTQARGDVSVPLWVIY